MPQLDKAIFFSTFYYFIIVLTLLYVLVFLYFIVKILHIKNYYFFKIKISNSIYFFNSFIFLSLLTLSTLILILVVVAFYTLAERKIIASIQRRRGPNVVGLNGLLQPFADGLKLVLKEINLPNQASKAIFLIAPFLTLIFSFLNWAIISFSFFDVIADLSLNLLITFIISSFIIYGIILAGWASNSRYPFLGALRSASQVLSYELSLTLIFLLVAALCHSFNFLDLVYCQLTFNLWFVVLLFPLFLIFFISVLAEINRAPFDLPEAEAELVAGYNLDYSSTLFAMFFLGEYSNIVLMATLINILFLGGWSLPIFSIEFFKTNTLFFEFINVYLEQKLIIIISFNFIFAEYISLIFEMVFCCKVVLICFMFVLIRATLPRLRYDQLIILGWKILLPLTCGFLIYVIGLMTTFGNNLNILTQLSLIIVDTQNLNIVI
jgi:NADH-quinone oxidoreductase subunit H